MELNEPEPEGNKAMERFKHLVIKHFEKTLVAAVLIATFFGFIDEKSVVLNFLQATFWDAGGRPYCHLVHSGRYSL